MTYAEHELYAQLRLAEALAAGGETTDAEVELVPAYQRARSLGAMPLVEEMETLARRARLKLPAMAPIAADAERGLTGREREVLVLVAQGRTNREIGKTSSLARRQPACTSPTSWPSSEQQTAPKPVPRRVHSDSIDCSCAYRPRCEPRWRYARLRCT
jgi:hypothetical protein